MNIYEEIKAERDYQDSKWGHEFDDTHSPADWWTFVTFYYAKYLDSWRINKQDPDAFDDINLRKGLIKVAAIVVAWIESLDRKKYVK